MAQEDPTAAEPVRECQLQRQRQHPAVFNTRSHRFDYEGYLACWLAFGCNLAVRNVGRVLSPASWQPHSYSVRAARRGSPPQHSPQCCGASSGAATSRHHDCSPAHSNAL